MIKIEHNQIVPENPDLRVLSVSGEYSDNDLIECASIQDPDFALCAFSATFIKYGSIVNQFNDPLLLGEALLKIDPECTHDTAILFKEEEIRRIKREGGDFTPENPVPSDENISPIAQEEISKEQTEEVKKKEENIKETNVVETAPLSSDTSTSTPPTETSTTTEEILTPIEPVIPEPEIIPTSPEPVSPQPVSEIPGPVETIIDSVSNAVN